MRADVRQRVRFAAAFVACVAMCATARADDVLPAYLEIEEFEPGSLRVAWKVPLAADVPAHFAPRLPESFRRIPPGETVNTPSTRIARWTMVCGDATLAGATIGVNGLEATTMDALVRIRFADGSMYRTVLRPTAPSTEIPVSESGRGAAAAGLRSVLPPTSRWLYPLLLLVAWLLSLNPRAVRRGILLCAVALVAGSWCGRALGGLPIREKLAGTGAPSEAEARRIVRGLMLNTYRAFMLDDEEQIYDVLARSVAGDFLHDVYLQNREAMRIDPTDAALSLIDRLDVRSIESMEHSASGAITVIASWDVYGSVFHWEHVHFRCNTYRAELTIVPADGYWKLIGLQLLDQQRVI